ncbi:phosphate-induced protein 1, partial [Gorgonomyces haynaldii]
MHPLLLAAAEASRKIHHKEGHHRPPVNHAVAPQHIDYIPGRLSMVNPMKVHLVWYGSAWTEKQKKSVADFVSGMGQSDIWNVAAKYYNTPVNRTERTYVTKQVTLGNQVVDLGSKGNILNTDPSNPLNDVPVIINKFIQSGELPSSSDDVYLLISDKNTLEGGACQGYCGYHSSVKSDEIFAGQPYPFQHTDFKYSWVGNMEACGPDFMVFYCGRRNDVISPTGDVGIDRMFSTIIHEVMEASSNPDVDNDETAWNDAEGNENADMCAYQYGPNAKFENGYYYNAEWNGQKYYIQSNYDPERQFC